MLMDISVNICLGTLMYIIEEIKQRKTHFTKLDPSADVFICYLFSFQLLDVHLRLIILLTRDNERTELLCQRRINLNKSCSTNYAYLCQRSLRLNLGRPPSSSLLHLPMQWLIYQVIIEHLLSDRFLKQELTN